MLKRNAKRGEEFHVKSHISMYSFMWNYTLVRIVENETIHNSYSFTWNYIEPHKMYNFMWNYTFKLWIPTGPKYEEHPWTIIPPYSKNEKPLFGVSFFVVVHVNPSLKQKSRAHGVRLYWCATQSSRFENSKEGNHGQLMDNSWTTSLCRHFIYRIGSCKRVCATLTHYFWFCWRAFYYMFAHS